MLVLSRKSGEGILVGDTLIVVVRNGQDGIRLGIAAPEDVPIMRTELLPSDQQYKLHLQSPSLSVKRPKPNKKQKRTA